LTTHANSGKAVRFDHFSAVGRSSQTRPPSHQQRESERSALTAFTARSLEIWINAGRYKDTDIIEVGIEDTSGDDFAKVWIEDTSEDYMAEVWNADTAGDEFTKVWNEDTSVDDLTEVGNEETWDNLTEVWNDA